MKRSNTRKSKLARGAGRVRPSLDVLEERNLLVAPYVDLAGVLTIDGTLWADTVSVRFLPLSTDYRVRIENVDGIALHDFDASIVTSISFRGHWSDDHFTNKTSLRCEAFGGAGQDTLIGGPGFDSLMGEAGDDFIQGGEGQDYLYGGDNDDLVFGWMLNLWGTLPPPTNPGNDVLYGNAGHDTLGGHNGNDWLSGGTENDWLFGEGGKDTLQGGGGFDSLWGGTGSDRLVGGADNDVLDGGSGNDLLKGGTGHDSLYGGHGNDEFRGEDGDDHLYDRARGDDPHVIATHGTDIVYGGSGYDTAYAFEPLDTNPVNDLEKIEPYE